MKENYPIYSFHCSKLIVATLVWQLSLAGCSCIPNSPSDQGMATRVQARVEEPKPAKIEITPATRDVKQVFCYIKAKNKIEKTGTERFPSKDGQKLYGELLMRILIRPDGSLAEGDGVPSVERSSGNVLLDEAALGIVRLAAPFGDCASLTAGSARKATWEIVYRFEFMRGGILSASSDARGNSSNH